MCVRYDNIVEIDFYVFIWFISLFLSRHNCFLKFISFWICFVCFFFFKQKTAYDMRISDWSSDVCSSDLLVTIEDVHELILPRHRNRVHLMYGGTRGRVSATESLAACMRLSPDRIFLAELRGPETWDYLAALNTGYPGSVTTTHSNGAADAFDRLAMLIKQSPTGGNLDLPTIQAFLRQTIDIVLHFERFRLKELLFEPRRQINT